MPPWFDLIYKKVCNTYNIIILHISSKTVLKKEDRQDYTFFSYMHGKPAIQTHSVKLQYGKVRIHLLKMENIDDKCCINLLCTHFAH